MAFGLKKPRIETSNIRSTVDHPAYESSFTLLTLLTISANAQDSVLSAISDFTDIDAGEVPYYIDDATARNVLAIDAAVVEYRNKFARATTTFSGISGVYDVSITSLGEIDGEGEFRFLINGKLKGSGVNQLVQEDWGKQYHVFENLQLTAGDLISVESNATSNRLIPENDEYAFARGRWKSLSLVFDVAATANATAVDLSITVESDKDAIRVGDSVAFSLAVTNESTDDTATALLLNATMTDNLEFESGGQCRELVSVVNCELPELAPGERSVVSFRATGKTQGSAGVAATIASAQLDTNTSNNADNRWFVVLAADTPDVSELGGSGDSNARGGSGAPGLILLLAGLLTCLCRLRTRNTFND